MSDGQDWPIEDVTPKKLPPAQATAVDDARKESAERLAFLYRQLGHTGTEQLAERCLSAESKIAELEAQLQALRDDRESYLVQLKQIDVLEAQLRQEREARCHGGDGSCDHCGAVPSINIPTSLCSECRDGIARAEKAEAQVAQLQTTISQQSKVCDEIREIAVDYRSGEYSTPGGLEHMGDVWRLIAKWDAALANITPKPKDGK